MLMRGISAAVIILYMPFCLAKTIYLCASPRQQFSASDVPCVKKQFSQPQIHKIHSDYKKNKSTTNEKTIVTTKSKAKKKIKKKSQPKKEKTNVRAKIYRCKIDKLRIKQIQENLRAGCTPKQEKKYHQQLARLQLYQSHNCGI